MVNSPPLLIPEPFKVSTPVLVMVWPLRSSAAPLATEMAPVPNAVALPALSVPPEMVVPPLYVLVPDKVAELVKPAAVLIAPLPEIAPDKVTLLDPVKEIVPALAIVVVRLPTLAVSRFTVLPLLITILL